MSTRDRILDAAASVLRERGIAGSTTREIARAAGCSEALLYKYFADKQEIFLAVLSERAPDIRPPDGLAGTGDLAGNLGLLVEQLLAFFVQTFPMAVSVFGAPNLLADHRAGVKSRGYGPEGPVRIVAGYLDEERSLGRLPAVADTDAAARLLVGAAFHRAFLAAYEGESAVADEEDFGERIATIVLSGVS